MGNGITKKQHYIPKTHLRSWIKDDILSYYSNFDDKHLTSKYNSNKKTFSPDYFYYDYFYESDLFEVNNVERELAWIETKFAVIRDKIVSSDCKVKLNRKELEIIKTFIFVSSLRSNAFRNRLNNLDGDFLFRLINYEKTEEEKLNGILKDITTYIKIAKIGQLKSYSDAVKYREREYKKNPFINNPLIQGYERYASTTIKIVKSEGNNFMLTDNYSATINSYIIGGGNIVQIFPINTDTAIFLLPSTALSRFAMENKEILI